MPKLPPPRPVRSHTFRGIRYRISHDCQIKGLTTFPGGVDKAEIWINSDLIGQERLQVEVHEALHASFPKLGEAAVVRAGNEIGAFLWRLGYRLR